MKKAKQNLTWAEAEALRLRRESCWLETGQWEVKTGVPGGADPTEAKIEVTQIDCETERFLMPMIGEQLGKPDSSLTGFSVMCEIAEDYLSGRTSPFVEGEPIGCIRREPPRRAAPELRTHAEIMEGRREELHTRRERNDRVVEQLLRRCR